MAADREKFKVYNNVFDNFTIRNLFKLCSEGFFEELKSAISVGKESNIFTATRKDGSLVIVKIYRVENCNFNRMYDYIKQDPRYLEIAGKRREIVFTWTQREFRNLLRARDVIRVPTPYKVRDNIIVMELIGGETPARQLKDARPTDPGTFFDTVIEMMRRLWKHGLVHGDLSHFNILNLNEEPVFIDFSQATVTENAQALELLKRDIANVVTFFNGKCGLNADAASILQKIHKG